MVECYDVNGGGICIILQIIAWLIPDNQMLLSIFRHNFVGWLPVFLIGVWAADADLKDMHINITVEIALTLCVVLLCCVVQTNFYLSLMLPFLAIVAFFFLADMAQKTKIWKKIILWIGKYSPYIFVTQTIAVGISRRVFEDTSDIVLILSYWGLTIALALAYKVVNNKLRRIAHI